MPEDSLTQRFQNKYFLLGGGLLVFSIGIVLGTFLIAPVFFPRAGNPPNIANTSPLSFGPTIGNYTAGAFDSDPKLTLRLIQAIGILLPLFTGLLRLTTDEQSAVSETANNFLLYGIFGLVFGGIIAAIGGMKADIAGVLKASLLFVLFTFVVIGIAAIMMFEEMSNSGTETGEQDPERKQDGADSGEGSEAATGNECDDSTGDTSDDAETEVESDSEGKKGHDESDEAVSEPDSEESADDRDDKQL